MTHLTDAAWSRMVRGCLNRVALEPTGWLALPEVIAALKARPTRNARPKRVRR